ncbi:uncharacterized protein LOC135105903 isoform X1 [Scylla paramamosain]|uniref:uncharacterized protein LOC135105903 isoform X1 n=1 Tax=Scylla paramamosain TaxID=85552 RepID=UPI0030827434
MLVNTPTGHAVGLPPHASAGTTPNTPDPTYRENTSSTLADLGADFPLYASSYTFPQILADLSAGVSAQTSAETHSERAVDHGVVPKQASADWLFSTPSDPLADASFLTSCDTRTDFPVQDSSDVPGKAPAEPRARHSAYAPAEPRVVYSDDATDESLTRYSADAPAEACTGLPAKARSERSVEAVRPGWIAGGAPRPSSSWPSMEGGEVYWPGSCVEGYSTRYACWKPLCTSLMRKEDCPRLVRSVSGF